MTEETAEKEKEIKGVAWRLTSFLNSCTLGSLFLVLISQL